VCVCVVIEADSKCGYTRIGLTRIGITRIGITLFFLIFAIFITSYRPSVEGEKLLVNFFNVLCSGENFSTKISQN